MAFVRIRIGPPLGEPLSPQDLQITGGIIDLYYLLCLWDEYGSHHVASYEIEIREISYNSPLDVIFYLKNISAESARRISERVFYFPQEKERREIENQKSRQHLLSMKLDNVERLATVRKKLLDGGMSEDEAVQILRDVLLAQDASLNLRLDR